MADRGRRRIVEWRAVLRFARTIQQRQAQLFSAKNTAFAFLPSELLASVPQRQPGPLSASSVSPILSITQRTPSFTQTRLGCRSSRSEFRHSGAASSAAARKFAFQPAKRPSESRVLDGPQASAETLRKALTPPPEFFILRCMWSVRPIVLKKQLWPSASTTERSRVAHAGSYSYVSLARYFRCTEWVFFQPR